MATLKLRADFPDGRIKLYFDSRPVTREIDDTCKLLRIDLASRRYEVVEPTKLDPTVVGPADITLQAPYTEVVLGPPNKTGA
ncbi:MAG: hypothetical protein JWL69_4444 [Phycisphaerales bacterium]|nr:hypothetical protein [Phycisphaerales bacterium]MDB5358565.1 hypothetical protein [Phycisphaerales bacterium]